VLAALIASTFALAVPPGTEPAAASADTDPDGSTMVIQVEIPRRTGTPVPTPTATPRATPTASAIPSPAPSDAGVLPATGGGVDPALLTTGGVLLGIGAVVLLHARRTAKRRAH
jgi:hypothetical protein